MIIKNIKIRVDYTEDRLLKKIAKACDVRESEIVSYKLLKRSVDARNRSDVCFVMNFDVVLKTDSFEPASGAENVETERILVSKHETVASDGRTVVVGSGPAGLFCALTLARAGRPPLLIERCGEVE